MTTRPITTRAGRLARYGADANTNVDLRHEEHRVRQQADRYLNWARDRALASIAVYPQGTVRGSSSAARMAVQALESRHWFRFRTWEPTVTREELPE